MTNTDRPVAERLIIRYDHFVHLKSLTKTKREEARVNGTMDGLAEAADIFGIAVTPFAFHMAMKDARRVVAPKFLSAGTNRESAAAERKRYYDALIVHVYDCDGISINEEV